MVALDFLNFIDEFQVTSSIGLEDFADRYNNIYTVICLFMCMLVISMKEYFMDPLTCYIPIPHDGKTLEGYVDDYCWVQGTYAISAFDEMPESDDAWEKMADKRIYYYQWVPVVLGMQCILFIVPRILWQMFTFNKIGTDLQRLVTVAQEAGHQPADQRDAKVMHIVRVLEEIIFKHRNFKKGRLSGVAARFDSFVLSKRLGNELSGYYVIMKLICFANNVGQLLLMQRFLGLGREYRFFGYEILKNIFEGRDWNQTMIFPRVTFCRPELKHLGTNNKLVAQCAIPVNMLNEKIYIFLWFWMVIGAALTAFSFLQWLVRINMDGSHAKFVRRYLRVKKSFHRSERQLVNLFVSQFLRKDGIFVLRMLSLNVGDLTTSDVVTQLWALYKEKYQHRDMRKDPAKDSDSGSEMGTHV